VPSLPKISADKAIKALERHGFVRIRQKGSHVVLKKITPDGEIGCVVPAHGELAVGTLRGVLKQAKITPQEFMDSL